MIITLFLAAAYALSPWQGEYSLQQTVDSGQEGMWSAILKVKDCNEKSCQFSFNAGSAQSECAAQGKFSIHSSQKADFNVDVRPESSDQPRGKCIISFERRKAGAIFVDARDVFATKKDEELGNPCNSLCGFQGASYFGQELPKLTEKTFFNPSFSCYGKLTKIESAICTDEKLATLDRQMSDQVAKLKSDQPKAVAKLTTGQRAWLKSRDTKCAHTADITSCLSGVYQARSSELAKP